ncbi:glycosyltransferase family 4 protein [Metabacillus sp. Hm71]|uniref:glycosyltransferase family 4 protein n=1 Tax=Metabacillus sp. Hm71 TaxID=3450743 RepID=UPI003F439915
MNKEGVIMGEESNPTVLILTSEYRDNIIGGLGRHVTDLTSVGSKQGMNFIVVTSSNTHEESYMIENGIHVFRLLSWQRRPHDFVDHIRNMNFRFVQFVIQELPLSFDLIHVHDWLTGLAGEQIKQILHKPLIATIHATERGRKQGVDNFLTKQITDYESKLIQVSDRVIVCSQFMRTVLQKEFACPIHKLEIIPNGIIPVNYLDIINRKDVFPFKRSKYFLGMGRLVKEKGFQLLIQAFADIHKDYPEIKLVIAGEGPYEDELKELTKNLHIEENVYFTGFVQELARNTLIKNCELVVVPSIYEPFGIIALEGMIASKPVVAFQIGGLTEILKDGRGILVQETTSVSLMECLRDYLTNPKRFQMIAHKGYMAANTTYNWSNLIHRVFEFYTKTVKIEGFSSENKI